MKQGSNQPLISIVTVVFNAESTIEETILSVICQEYKNIEYIIIDGGSTDGTLEIIKKYENKIDYLISEPDKGIYDAMNKGISLAKGKYVYFINAGDILINLPFKELSSLKSSLVAFPVKLSSGVIFYPVVNSNIKLRNTLPHQGCYYLNTPDLLYNENYKVFADFDLNQNYFKNGKEIKVFSTPVVAFHNIEGISHNKEFSSEIFEVVGSNFGKYYQFISFIYFKTQGLKSRFNILKQ